ALLAVQRGAQILRVHDVRATEDALKIWKAEDQKARTTETQRHRESQKQFKLKLSTQILVKVFSVPLMELLAIRLNDQTTLVKSLVMCLCGEMFFCNEKFSGAINGQKIFRYRWCAWQGG
ncbi:MAG: hypothetical protein Q7S51_11305, partial [Gallionellaceae bacterium]|nr:hypothetical protein [Gallionellaceae bacterium]